MRFACEKPLSCALSIVLALGAAPRRGRADDAREPAAPGLARLIAVAQEEIARPGARPWDVQAKAAELGNDPARIFAFVRDEVRFEPYRGVLRGARGALSCRAANADDKSLLLKALLEAGGHHARLVRGKLPREKAEALVKAFLAAPPSSGPLAECFASSDRSPLREAAARAGIDAAKAVARASDADARALAFRRDAWPVALREAKALSASLKQAGVPLGQTYEQRLGALTDRAVEHVWVELQEGLAGKAAPVALDPSVAGSTAGDCPGEHGSALEPAALERHAVHFAFIYRRATTDKTGAAAEVEEKLLERTIAPEDALFEPWDFSIVPADRLPTSTALARMKGPELEAALGSLKHYQAVLRTGDRRTGSRPFDLDGKTYQVGPHGEMVPEGGGGGASLGGLGGGLGGGGKDDKAGAARLVELAVELRIDSPGAPSRTNRRVLFTAADARERHERPLLSWEILVAPQVITARTASAGEILALAPLLKALADRSTGPFAPEDVDRLAPLDTRAWPVLLMELERHRQAAMADILREIPKSAVLFDAPDVLVGEFRCDYAPEVGLRTTRVKIDIVQNALAFVPRETGAGETAARAALLMGAFDTVAEAQVLRSHGPAPATDVRSAVTLAERARADGKTAKPFRASDAAALAASGLPEPDRAWIAKYEAPDRVILPLPGPEGGAGWWSIDASSGTALGRLSGGGGQSMVEYAIGLAITIGICGLLWYYGDNVAAAWASACSSWDRFHFFRPNDPEPAPDAGGPHTVNPDGGSNMRTFAESGSDGGE